MSDTVTLFHLFMELPPRFNYIETLLISHTYTCVNIDESFCAFIEECFCEYRDFIDEHGRKPSEEEIHSTYVFPLCELLLKYGLDPNYVFGELYSQSNVMYHVYWIDTPYVAADTLRLLLEHGGDPNLLVDGESIWHLSDFDIWFDVTEGYAIDLQYRTQFDSRFHFWLVLRGFLSSEEKMFKNHLLYTYNLIQHDKDHWDIRIIKI